MTTNTTPRTYVNGDEAEYTGETCVLHGSTFYVLRILEGARAGQSAVTGRPPVGPDPYAERARADWRQMQAGFSRLREGTK